MNYNMLDYISWRGDITFDKSPFNNIDAAILAHLAYEHIEGLVSPQFKDQITLRELTENFKASADLRSRTHMGFGINPKTPEILYEAGKSERFGTIKVCGLREIFSEEKVEQFAAVTYVIGSTAVVAFRGTDDTVAGWCEDIDIAKNVIIPSHTDGLDYFNDAASYFKNDLMLLGHSKGGSVAVYAGTFTESKIQTRIKAIYNLDGPGWSKAFYEEQKYKNIEDKLLSVYPSDDIVGKVFYPTKNFIIIKANKKGIDQHDMLNWCLQGKDFIKEKDYTDNSKIVFKSFNKWYEEVPDQARISFLDSLSRLYVSGGYKNNYDLMQNKAVAAKNMINCYNSFDKQTRSDISNVLNTLGKIAAKELPIGTFINESKDFFNVELPNSIKEEAKKVAIKIEKAKNEMEKAIKDSNQKKIEASSKSKK